MIVDQDTQAVDTDVSHVDPITVADVSGLEETKEPAVSLSKQDQAMKDLAKADGSLQFDLKGHYAEQIMSQQYASLRTMRAKQPLMFKVKLANGGVQAHEIDHLI